MAKDILGPYEDPRTSVLEEKLIRLAQKLEETLERVRRLESHIENEEKKRRQDVITLTDTYRIVEPEEKYEEPTGTAWLTGSKKKK